MPIGERALAWGQRYLDEARPQLVADLQERMLFLNRHGRAFQGSGLGERVRRYIEPAAVSKRGACHLFRHAMATQMLEHGADIRYTRAMLGHESLDATQIYTHVSIAKLQAVHAATHPWARLKRRVREEEHGDEG